LFLKKFMDWHITDVESLAMIDRTISNNRFSPAEYEIIRQIIYRTADFDYYSSIHFSQSALHQGIAALSAHTSIIVDLAAIQIEIAPLLYETFLNPVYCCTNVDVKLQPEKTKFALGLVSLAKGYPDSIYIIGQEQTALKTLVELVTKKITKPSLIIATAPVFTAKNSQKWLLESKIPHICLKGQKGGVNVAISIIKSLIALAWYAEKSLKA
jgi:precorrin-8X/cobalt-precorrin-8 methylmutase